VAPTEGIPPFSRTPREEELMAKKVKKAAKRARKKTTKAKGKSSAGADDVKGHMLLARRAR
jgi:hypothetical protein